MKKRNKNNPLNNSLKIEIPSTEYTIDELIELGKKNNTINIAPPLFIKENQSDETNS